MGDNSPVPVYGVELLYASPPRLSSQDLLESLRERLGAAEPGEDPTSLLFDFPDLADPSREGGRPAGLGVEPAVDPLDEIETAEALGGTRDWPGAEAAVRRHRARLLVVDRRASAIPYKNRMRIFRDGLLAVVGRAAPLAVFWRPAAKLVNPAALGGPKPDPLRELVGLRLLPAPGGGASMMLDTVGLAPLGLPDLECPVKGVDPAGTEPFLLSLARYLYDLGDVIPDGRVLKGPDGKTRYACVRAPSAHLPARTVLSLRPA
jgi:hypothetical protein